MNDGIKTQIRAICQANHLVLAAVDIDQEVVVLALETLPDPNQSFAVATAIKALGHRWVTFEVRP